MAGFACIDLRYDISRAESIGFYVLLFYGLLPFHPFTFLLKGL